MRCTSLVLAGALSILFYSNVGFAQDENAQAKEAFVKGKAAFLDGRFSDAAKAFRIAESLKPSWKLYYNIGQSEAAAKRYGLALESFEKYMADGGDDVGKERQKEIREEITRLREMVGFVAVSAPEGSTVVIDGVDRGNAPLNRDLPVAASKNHVINATVDGETVAETSIQVSGGRTASVDLMVEKEEETTEPSEPEPIVAEEKSPLKTVGWLSVGLGGALLIGGGVTGGLAISKNGELQDNCEPDVCYSDNYDAMDSRDGLATTSTIMFVAGGVFAATGIALLLVSRKKGKESLDVVLAPGPGSVLLTGRF